MHSPHSDKKYFLLNLSISKLQNFKQNVKLSKIKILANFIKYKQKSTFIT
ncbi:hypothetical protein HFN_1852 [Helicobacter fennelliae MRY12-0050]|uniref:Uncharacterized protein n=1 Tax=Helicobacter fennelliae MRY12-0050 TaxID=1325130 RepID=T1CN88_9HELI|nr:hypothetical protein HFN_1852 [Helicobacter fennelliae MRY12-0050]